MALGPASVATVGHASLQWLKSLGVAGIRADIPNRARNPQKQLDTVSIRCLYRDMDRTMDRNELRQLLEGAQMSQTELAREVGVTQEAVCQWLSGKHKMHPVFAKVIREVLERKGAA